MSLKIPYTIITGAGAPRMSFSREEILYMINQLNAEPNAQVRLATFLENLMQFLESES